MNEALAVYVPNGDAGVVNAATIAHIDRGSGIVSRHAAMAESHVPVYYEGNRYGYANVNTYADRCFHAADRLVQHYPTIATSLADRAALLFVGYFNFGHGVDLTGGFELIQVAKWLGLWDGSDVTDHDRLAAELRVTR